jgi:hypothetical protein
MFPYSVCKLRLNEKFDLYALKEILFLAVYMVVYIFVKRNNNENLSCQSTFDGPCPDSGNSLGHSSLSTDYLEFSNDILVDIKVQMQKHRIDSSISIPVIHHKWIKLQRLVAHWAFGKQFRFVPGFGREVEAGGLVIWDLGTIQDDLPFTLG